LLFLLNNNLIFVLAAFGIAHSLTALLFYRVVRLTACPVVAGVAVIVLFLFYRRFIG
jgi:hypothetical protein